MSTAIGWRRYIEQHALQALIDIKATSHTRVLRGAEGVEVIYCIPPAEAALTVELHELIDRVRRSNE